MNPPANRLVIGLDYGTTFTGVAFHERTSAYVKVDEIHQLMDWPKTTAEKIPSEVSYQNDGTVSWGYDISPTARKLVWTKLELDEQRPSEELRMILEVLSGMGNLDLARLRGNGGLPSYPGKDPVDIVADFLGKVREHTLIELARRYRPELLKTLPIDLVITVPAVWSDIAKDRTFRAVSKAGFNEQYFPSLRATLMVAEPEAAAIYTLRSLKDSKTGEDILPGDCFVLCDAGGGTVDLISYRVKTVSPSFSVEEAAIGTGDKCGGSFVDRNFRTWLEKRLGPSDYEKIAGEEGEIGAGGMMEPKLMKMMKAFTVVKMTFTGDPAEHFLPLPKPLNQADDDDRRGIIDGELRMTDQDLREVFDPCIEKTLRLIGGQIDQVRRTGSSVKYVFLVGGFGRSIYMFNRIKEYSQSLGIHTIHPKNPWSAVARGAVARGLEQEGLDLIYLRKCRRHYGVHHSEIFSPFRHSEEDAYIDEHDGVKKAKGQMTWLIKKGDALVSTQPKHASIDLSRRFGLQDNKAFMTALYACDDDVPPTRMRDGGAFMVCNLTADLNSVPVTQFRLCRTGRRDPYYIGDFKIEIQLHTLLDFKVTFDGQEMGSVECDYRG